MPGIPGGWELVLLLGVLVLLFGATKLPNAARSIGQSMRIFKAETKGMRSDEGQAKESKDQGNEAAQQDRSQEALPPSTQAPSTQAPSTQAPSTQAPSTQAPSTQAPSTQAPSADPSRPAEQPHRTDTTR